MPMYTVEARKLSAQTSHHTVPLSFRAASPLRASAHFRGSERPEVQLAKLDLDRFLKQSVSK